MLSISFCVICMFIGRMYFSTLIYISFFSNILRHVFIYWQNLFGHVQCFCMLYGRVFLSHFCGLCTFFLSQYVFNEY